MRLLSFLMLISVSLFATPQPAAMAQTIVARQSDGKELERLFAALRKSKSELIASDIVGQIREEWLNSGSANIDLMMKWSQQAMDEGRNEAALDWLDQVIRLKPDYAEGWNLRATLHFTMNNHAKSMADIEKTLQLEPRHFGALAGLGAILMTYEKRELALKAYRKALDINPMMRDIQATVGQLEDEIAGSRI